MNLKALTFAQAFDRIASGEAVAFPTSCGYGFAMDPFLASATALMAKLKPERTNPVGLIAASREQVDPLVLRWTSQGKQCAELWPAELTLVLEAVADLPAMIVSPVGGVAVRVPADTSARELARTYGGVLTATSLNRSGQPTTKRPQDLVPFAHVLAGYIEGPTGDELPSTLVDVLTEEPRILRPGRVVLSWP